MSLPIQPASKWPARAAFVAAGIFVSASGTINVTYGWAKGSDVISSLTWAAVAGAVAIVFALSWPALIRSLEARRWSAALVALVALLLAGGYSITAALGSASGGRTDAATTETATAEARKRAQAAYDAARAELEGLKPSRPLAELEALITAARPVCRIVVTLGRRDTLCAPPPGLSAELGRAKRRAELEAKVERASGELAATGPAKQANSDARTLARYLQAVGVNATPEPLNDLLVLLAVLMIEAGGGLSLALGMALQASPETRPRRSCDAASPAPEHPGRPPERPLDAGDRRSGHIERTPRTPRPSVPVQVSAGRPRVAHATDVTEWLALQGGRAETSMRRLASVLGRSPSGVHDELRRLAASGAITMSTGPRGTLVALRPN